MVTGFVLSHLQRDRGTGGMEGLIVNLGGARSTRLGHHTRQEAGRPPKMPLLDKYTTVAAGSLASWNTSITTEYTSHPSSETTRKTAHINR